MSEDRKGDGPGLFDEYAAIRKAPGLSAPEKLLLWAIHSRAGNGKGVCTASSVTLAEDIGHKQDVPEGETPEARAKRLDNARRSITNWIGTLREIGWIANEDGRKDRDPRPRLLMGPKFHEAAAMEAASKRVVALGIPIPSEVGTPIPSPLGISIPSSVSNWEKNEIELGKSSPELGKTAPGTGKNDVGNWERGFPQTTPRTAPENSSCELTLLNSPSESESTRVCEKKEYDPSRTEPLTEQEQREFWGDGVINFMKAFQPPSHFWWTWDPEKAEAVHAVETFFRDVVDKVGLVERLAQGDVTFCDVTTACIVVSHRDRREIGNLEAYLSRVARSLATDEQEASNADCEWQANASLALDERRKREEEAWEKKMFRPTMKAHMPEALRVFDQLAFVDAQRGVTEEDQGAMVPTFKRMFIAISNLLGPCGGWEGFSEAAEKSLAANPDVDLLGILRECPGWYDPSPEGSDEFEEAAV